MRRSEVLAAEAVSVLNKALSRLRDIWEEIGIPENQRLQRTSVAKNHIKDLLERMIQEEESMRTRILGSIQSCRTEREQLYLELQFPPFQEEEGISILQQEKNIRTQVEFLANEKSWRLQQLKVLLEEDRDLCDALCCPPYAIAAHCTPTQSQLQDLQQHISRQKEEKEKRRVEFCELKKQIILNMEVLDVVPESSFQRDVVCEDQDAFCLSRDNISSLRLLLGQLEERRVEVEEECVCVRGGVQRLWERLQVSSEERESLQQHMDSSKKRNLEALRAELRRLEELKTLSLRHMTQDVRRQIAAMWDKCLLSREQQQDFSLYHSEEVSEELLSLHDAELQRLQKHFEEHQQLFEGVQRWRESWRLFLQLENKAADPSRFTNRGGNLLRDEKQRTELLKSLPKLEARLKVQIEVWEGQQGRDFLVQGQKFLPYVEQQWEQHRARKQQQKLERQLKKSRQTEEDMLYGTAVPSPTKRRFLAPTTPNRSRKFNASNATLRSVHGGPVCRSPGPRPPLTSNQSVGGRTPVGGKPPQPRPREGNKENQENQEEQEALKAACVSGAPPPPAGAQRNYSLASVASTYSQFVRELVNTESVHTSETSQKPSTPGVSSTS